MLFYESEYDLLFLILSFWAFYISIYNYYMYSSEALEIYKGLLKFNDWFL
jgi:hypothetical protein